MDLNNARSMMRIIAGSQRESKTGVFLSGRSPMQVVWTGMTDARVRWRETSDVLSKYNPGVTRKIRIDRLLVERGLAESRSKAQRLVMAGVVRAEGQVVHKASQRFAANTELEVERGPRFVSRGGEKLDAALQIFPIRVNDAVCADVGASTGGFSDCLLQSGAKRIYAIDVGYGLLHWKLRNDPRVVLMERTNARHLERLPEEVDLVTIDASFISLRLLLPAIQGWMKDEGDLLALVKPQFEAGRENVGKGGVVRDPAVHQAVVRRVLGYAEDNDLPPRGVMRSPLTGPKGNVEFFLWSRKGTRSRDHAALLRGLFPEHDTQAPEATS
jgi:23S rRNA (cytidine1920-2'-O)/16S rRNA (cytidine1409-2'-O)-methyltransferase